MIFSIRLPILKDKNFDVLELGMTSPCNANDKMNSPLLLNDTNKRPKHNSVLL